MFGRKQRRIAELEQVATGLQGLLARIGEQKGEVARERAQLRHIRRQIEDAKDELAPLTEDLAVQRSGVLSYEHPLAVAEDYETRLNLVLEEMPQLIKSGLAIEGRGGVTYNGSSDQGTKMIDDWCTLMLRSYNAEAENCVRMMRAGSLGTAKKRLERTIDTINQLSELFGVRISPRYHALRIYELELTADYLQMKQQQRQRRTRKVA